MAAGPDLTEQRKLIEFAAKAAETFVSAYYSASDSPHRVQLLPTLYLPNSTIVWNGHPISGASNLGSLLNSMPGSKHEVQSFDCHPLSGGTENGAFVVPSLLLTVSGIVAHHTPGSLSAMPPSNAPNSTNTSSARRGNTNAGDGSDPSIPIESLPRAFTQNFILVHQGDKEGGVNCSGSQDESRQFIGRFFVQADTFRFVG